MPKIEKTTRVFYTYNGVDYETERAAKRRQLADEIFDFLWKYDTTFKRRMLWGDTSDVQPDTIYKKDYDLLQYKYPVDELRKTYDPATHGIILISEKNRKWFLKRLEEYTEL